MRDKVDERNRDRFLRGNLIKWWNVNLVSEEAEESSDNVDEDSACEIIAEDIATVQNGLIKNVVPDGLDEDERMLLELIMDKSDRSDVYNSVMTEINNEQEQQANEIYERLMREAAEDEAKKQREIEEAKLAAMGSGN